MKERGILFSAPMVRAILSGQKSVTRRIVKKGQIGKLPAPYPEILQRCPYGQPGDRLWVRETWAQICLDAIFEDEHEIEYRADTGARYPGGWPDELHPDEVPLRWRPSLFMPRKHSRITLEITDVKVQFLQEMTENDAIAEGFDSLPAFIELWSSINPEKGWDNNPIVWVITFNLI